MVDKAQPRQIVGLDALRFLAAASVMNFHLAVAAWIAPTSEAGRIAGAMPALPGAVPMLAGGWVGVEIFFVISGFVIALSAEGQSALGFLRGRLARLYPGILIAVALTLPLLVLSGAYPAGWYAPRIAGTLLLSPLGPWIDGVYWTLIVEISFYTMIFVLLLIDRFRAIDRIALLLGLFSLAYWLLATAFPGWTRLYPRGVAMLTLAMYGGSFALGMALWLMSAKRVTAMRLATAAIGFAASLIEIADASRLKLASLGIADARIVPPGLAFAIAMLLVLIAISAARTDRQGGARVAAVARAIGLATYPLYLIHSIVGASVIRFAEPSPASVTTVVAVAEAVCMAVAVAIALWIEPPLQRALKSAFDRGIRPRVARGRYAAALCTATTRVPIDHRDPPHSQSRRGRAAPIDAPVL